jgi:hypothetical protein
VDVVLPQSQETQEGKDEGEAGARGKTTGEGDSRGAEAGEDETRHAMVEYVVKVLNEELIIELLEGFHCEM